MERNGKKNVAKEKPNEGKKKDEVVEKKRKEKEICVERLLEESLYGRNRGRGL